SAFGSILCLLEILNQGWGEEHGEGEADQDDVERRLREQPPEPLAVRMQERQPVGLHEGPDDAAEHRHGADQIDGCRAERTSPQVRDRLGSEMRLHFPPARSRSRRARERLRARAYAGTGGGRLSNARPKRRRGARASVARPTGAVWDARIVRCAWATVASANRSYSASQPATAPQTTATRTASTAKTGRAEVCNQGESNGHCPLESRSASVWTR